MRGLMIFISISINLSCSLMKEKTEIDPALSKRQLAQIAFLSGLQYYKNISTFEDSLTYPINLTTKPAPFLNPSFVSFITCNSLKTSEAIKVWDEPISLDTLNYYAISKGDICLLGICNDSFTVNAKPIIYVSDLYYKNDSFFLITSIPGKDKFGATGIYHIYIEINKEGVVLEQCYGGLLDPNR